MILQTRQLSIAIGAQLLCPNFSLQINKSEFWGILGANGSGKTTLLHTLAGLRKSRGEIFYTDLALDQLKPKNLARLRGVLFQHFNAFANQTVYEYCLHALYAHPELRMFTQQKIQEMISRNLQLVDLALRQQQVITTLSGGEKRRLAIAALLTQQPQLYFLDEPSNHLDLHYQILILEHFANLCRKQQTTVLMAVHDVNLAQRFCDHLILLLPNGNWLTGPTHVLLTAENLSQLYQHPIKKICQNEHIYWLPA